jgi:hypothetical protein
MTQKFENIESEWPLFYSFLIIDGVFKDLSEQVSISPTFYEQLLIKKKISKAFLYVQYDFVFFGERM